MDVRGDLWSALERTAASAPERTALQGTGADPCRFSYGQTFELARRVGHAIARRGVTRGDRVALWTGVSPRWALAYLGIVYSGGVVVPLDAHGSAPELLRIARETGCRLLLASADVLAAGSYWDLEWPCPIIALERIDGLGLESLDNLMLEPAPPYPPVPGQPEDIATIIFTSGTTAVPRGVVIRHRSLNLVVPGMRKYLALSSDDNVLAAVPSHHVFAPIGNLLVPLAIGATITYLGSVSSGELAATIRDARITVFPAVPQIFYLMHRRILDELGRRPLPVRAVARLMLWTCAVLRQRFGVNAGRMCFRSVHAAFGGCLQVLVSGGSYFDPRIIRDLQALGFTVLQGYGLTETFGAGTVTPRRHNVPGSVGIPLPGVRVDILQPDESGIGEVAIGGPVVMEGYLNDPDATREVVRDGWLRTGDLGYVDAAGHYHITGRCKELVVLSSGKKVAPELLEHHYQQSRAIQEVCVIGIPEASGYAGADRLHAVVVPAFEYLKSQGIVSSREVIRSEMERLSRELPPFQRVLSYEVRGTPLPRTPTRKIVRWQVKREHPSHAGLEHGRATAPAAPREAAGRSLEIPLGADVLELLRREARMNRVPDLSMNLELDLGFDSLQRIELVANLERMLGVRLGDDAASQCVTVRELVDLVASRATASIEAAGPQAEAGRITWHEILTGPEVDRVDEPVLRVGRATSAVQFAYLKTIRLLAAPLFRFSVRGVERLPRQGPYLICPNHQSYVDGLLIASALPYPVVRNVVSLGWPALFGSRGVKGVLARMTNCVPIDPDRNLLRAMVVSAAALKRGKVLLIFPEGGLTWNGQLQPFKKGPAILAVELGVPIVPVAIKGSFDVWPKGGRRVRLSRVTVTIGRPIDQAVGASEGGGQRRVEFVAAALESEVRRLLEA